MAVKALTVDTSSLGVLARLAPLFDVTTLTASLLCFVVVSFFIWNKRTYSYWQRLGIKSVPINSIVGDAINMLAENRGMRTVKQRNLYGKVFGTYLLGKPRLIVADAEVVRQICVKDFDKFNNHSVRQYNNKFQDNFLVWLKGEHWKRVRALMTPTFTSAKIKRMFTLLDACADDLVANFREELYKATKLANGTPNSATSGGCVNANEQLVSTVVDLASVYNLYTMDGISTCCYGLRLDRGNTDSKSNQSSRTNSRDSFIETLRAASSSKISRIFYVILLPKFFLDMIGFKMTRESSSKPLVDILARLIEARRKVSGKYDDLLQLLVDARLDAKLELSDTDQAENHHAGLTRENIVADQEKLIKSLNEHAATSDNKSLGTKLSDLEVISEAMFMLAAGLETTSASLCAISYCLAHNQDIQDKLFVELSKIAKFNATPFGNQVAFEYDTLTSCEYFDAVISETLRFLPPAHMTDRQSDTDYRIDKYDITLQKGSQLLIGICALHYDPDYWHEPQKYDPDRFMPGQKERIVPGSYMPFGFGPRHCIGMRFSLTETKLGLAKVVMNYKFEPEPESVWPPVIGRGLSLSVIKNCRARVIARQP